MDPTRNHSWGGEEELSSCLQALTNQRPIAASKVKNAAKTAMKYSSEYKMVVYTVESFVRKAAADDKLPGLYVLDAICRQPKSQHFRDRFAIRIRETAMLVAESVSFKDKAYLIRLLEEWDRKNLFEKPDLNFTKMIAFLGEDYKTNGGNVRLSESNSASITPGQSSGTASHHPTISTVPADPRKRKADTPHYPSSASTAIATDTSAVSAAGSRYDQQPLGFSISSESPASSFAASTFSVNGYGASSTNGGGVGGNGHGGATYMVYGLKGERKRMCPFADSCVFGDKCRFSHSDLLAFQPSYALVPRAFLGVDSMTENPLPLGALQLRIGLSTER